MLRRLLLPGCATPPTDPVERAAFEQNNDPLEPLNRRILDFNLFLDCILIKPVTKVYIAIMPEEGRDAMRRALDNMKEPVVFINNVLQGELERAGITVERFVVNSTARASAAWSTSPSNWGLRKADRRFRPDAVRLGVARRALSGIADLGPSNPRDAIGMGIDAYIDPFSYLASAKGIGRDQIYPLRARRRRPAGPGHRRARRSGEELARFLCPAAQPRAAAPRRRTAAGAAPQPGAGFYDDPGKGRRRSTPASHEPAPTAGAEIQPARSAAVRCSISCTRPSAPLRCKTATNSERRAASSLTVPLRKTSMTFQPPPASCRSR